MRSNVTKPDSATGAKDDLKSIPMRKLQVKLKSSLKGLSAAEAQKRLADYGPNKIVEQKSIPFPKLLTYFWGPIPWKINVAVILSVEARHLQHSLIILSLLLVTVCRTRQVLIDTELHTALFGWAIG